MKTRRTMLTELTKVQKCCVHLEIFVNSSSSHLSICTSGLNASEVHLHVVTPAICIQSNVPLDVIPGFQPSIAVCTDIEKSSCEWHKWHRQVLLMVLSIQECYLNRNRKARIPI